MELHTAPVVEGSHDFYFFDQALFAFVFAVSCFLRKSFDCQTPTNLEFFSEINRCKVTLSDFLFWFELFMKASLVEFSF
jgi:hypothetical protein